MTGCGARAAPNNGGHRLQAGVAGRAGAGKSGDRGGERPRDPGREEGGGGLADPAPRGRGGPGRSSAFPSPAESRPPAPRAPRVPAPPGGPRPTFSRAPGAPTSPDGPPQCPPHLQVPLPATPSAPSLRVAPVPPHLGAPRPRTLGSRRAEPALGPAQRSHFLVGGGRSLPAQPRGDGAGPGQPRSRPPSRAGAAWTPAAPRASASPARPDTSRTGKRRLAEGRTAGRGPEPGRRARAPPPPVAGGRERW